MRSSILLAVLGAGLAIASPIVKKALVTEIETDIVYVYVTKPAPVHTTIVTLEVIPTQAKVTTTHKPKPKPHTHSHSTTPTTTSTPPPPPPPTTTEAPPPPPSTTPPPPPPTTTPPPPPPTTKAPPPPPPTTTAAPAPVNNNAGGGGGGLPDGSDFESKVIYHHNVHRQNHSAANAEYDTRMAGYAQQVASSCHYAHDLSPGGGGYGQNIAAYGATGDSGVGAAQAVAMAISDMWYDGEVNNYLPSYYGQDNPDMGTFESWGHFSQVVWDGSTGIGCAAVLCPDGSIFKGFETWFTVCNYFPAGNMGGEYGANVHPSRGEDTVTS